MAVYVADARIHVQRLVSAVKIVTVLEEYTIEERRSIVCFFGQNDCKLLFTLGSVCRLKRFTPGWQSPADDEEVETEVRKGLRQQ
jgi:hypothetical protein